MDSHVHCSSLLFVLVPVLRGLLSPRYRTPAIGIVLLLLVATSLLETFLLYIFRLIQLALVIIAMSLGGAELICWLRSDLDRQLQEDDNTGEETAKV